MAASLSDSMTAQQIIEPSKIESRLQEIWDDLGKNKKMMRACLFNLIVYTKMSERTDYFRTIVQHIIDKFPSRVIFITADSNSKESYLKTAVSVVTTGEKENTFACDNIDIAVGGKDYERVPFVILPLIIPDLPAYLLWAEDPCETNPLFEKLQKFASRIIFDSESSSSLMQFANSVVQFEEKKHPNVADMNWARTEHWRDLIAATFYSANRLEKLKNAATVEIAYNKFSSEYFTHVKVQSIYVQAWLASRLEWQFKSVKEQGGKDIFIYESNGQEVQICLAPKESKLLKPGAVMGVTITDRQKEVFCFSRNPENPTHISIEVSSEEKCELPHHFILPDSATGQSLVKEITYHATSRHFLMALKYIIDKNLNV